jgi:hypothetical protein
VVVSSCAYAAAGSGDADADGEALEPAPALGEDFFGDDVADALGVGVTLGEVDAAGAWMHHEDFVTCEVMPFFADSAADRLG